MLPFLNFLKQLQTPAPEQADFPVLCVPLACSHSHEPVRKVVEEDILWLARGWGAFTGLLGHAQYRLMTNYKTTSQKIHFRAFGSPNQSSQLSAWCHHRMVPCYTELTDAIEREAAQGRRMGRLMEGLEGGREAAEAEREELVLLAENGFQELSLVPSASCHRRTDSKLVMGKHPCHVCNATWVGWGLGRALCCHKVSGQNQLSFFSSVPQG